MRKRLLVARKFPRSSDAADASVKAKPSSMIEATSEGFSPHATVVLAGDRAAAVLVDAPVEGLDEREERLLALAQRLAAQLEPTQVLGRVEAVGQPEEVQEPLPAVRPPHRADDPREGRLVLREVARGVAGAEGERADLAQLGLEEALLEDAQAGVDVDEEDVPALVALGGRQVGERGAEELLDLGRPPPPRSGRRRGP